MFMRRRPLLAATMIGGGAYMAGRSAAGNAQREQGQEQRLAELEARQTQAAPAPAPAPVAAAPAVDIVGGLTKPAALKDAGVLTDAEFNAAKAKLLGS